MIRADQPPPRRSAEGEALRWFVRSQASDFRDWPALQDWLQRSAANGAAFDAELARAERLDALVPALRAQIRDGAWPTTAKRRLPVSWSVGGALAAASLAVVLHLFAGQETRRWGIATRAAQSQTLTLESGASIAIGPDARVDLVGSRTGETVIMGQGDMRLRAPASAPLLVVVGDDMVRVANASALIQRRHGRLKVSVADGPVFIGPASGRRGPQVTLPPGSRLDHVEGTTVFNVHEPGAADVVIR